VQKDNDKILLILDLDETLVHSKVENVDFVPDFELFDYKVIKRPYLAKFLTNCSKNFKIAIWSSASDDYVAEMVKQIIPDSIELEFVWGRSKATYRPTFELNEIRYAANEHFYYIKRLKKIKQIGYRLEKALIVDDTPHKSKENYGNAIYVKEFYGEPEDNELQILEKYLFDIKDIADVRKIEKRGWRLNYEK